MVGWQSPAPDLQLVGPQRAMDRIPSMARTSFSAPEAHIVVSTDGYFDVYPTSPRTNGDKRFSRAARNEVAVMEPDGVLRTYFRPTDGPNYWLEQIAK